MKKYKVGFIQGVFDMFHIGHLNLLKRAKDECEYLIVGVNSDELVMDYKGKNTIISFDDRIEIVSAIKYVDQTVKMNDRDKIKALNKYKFDVIFMGSDWQNTEFYNNIEKQLKEYNVDIVYFPYTQGISSTLLRKQINGDSEK